MFDPLRKGDPDEVGGYRLRARLGSGGMGEVFLSFAESGRAVAVKAIRREFADDPQFRARFAHEVRAARRVSGPHIAQLLDADPDAQTPWLATAYIAGPTLAEAVELYGPLPVSSVIVLIAGIAEALATIHAAGIVHRDLKPANVVLGADGLRVIDFGIARAADATALTLTGNMVGSPQYVAPEQILGEPPTPAGDVFSLGALAHFAATGRAAFGDGPKVGVVYRVVNAKPDLAGCPLQLRSLISSCLAKDPADRPSTAEIIDTCRPEEPALHAADWLPPAVVFAIDSYSESMADLLTPAPSDAEPKPEPAPARQRPRKQRGAATLAAIRRRPRRAAIGLAAALALIGAGTGAALAISPTSRSAAASDPGAGTSSVGASHGSAQPVGAQSQPPATAPPDSFPPPGGGPGPGGGPPPPPPTAVAWSGTVRFTDAGMWLDGSPPTSAQGGPARGDIRESAPAPAAELSSNSPQVANLALWTSSGTPTGAQCQDLALTQGVSQLHVTVGAIVCALTAHRQVAILRIETFPRDYSGVTAFATVWGGGR